MFNYICIHLSGIENDWADLFGRLSAPPGIRRIISVSPLASSQDEDLFWQKADAVRELQQYYISNLPRDMKRDSGFYINESGAAWIPDPAEDFKLRVCIAGHTGPGGQRGTLATTKAIRKHFVGSNMRSDIQTFVKACIHCISPTDGQKIPRPLGASIHETRPHDLLRFDHIEIAPSNTGEKYILMLRDKFSTYDWLISFASTKAENAADAIIEWFSTFVCPKGLMPDGQPILRTRLSVVFPKGSRFHITSPYRSLRRVMEVLSDLAERSSVHSMLFFLSSAWTLMNGLISCP